METVDRATEFNIATSDTSPERLLPLAEAMMRMHSIPRFSEVPMIHHNSVMEHSLRLRLSCMHMSDYLRKVHGLTLDGAKLDRFSQYHDYPEMLTGDIPTPIKASLSEAEKTSLKETERKAITQIAEAIAPDFVDLFQDDFDELTQKTSNEAQLLDIADKLDGFCEVITDIRCGNDTPEVDQVYANYLKVIKDLDRHPLMTLLKQNPSWGIGIIPSLDEVKALPPIDLNLLNQGKEKFWNRVFDENLPQVYKYWLHATTNPNSLHQGILPAYSDILKEYQMTSEERIKLVFLRERL